LKQKTAERKSKKEVLKGYVVTTGAQTPSPEGSLITQGAIDKLHKDIKELRGKIKKNIQQKNEYFSTKITTQKTIDLYTNQVKVIDI
jgi:hypothetical protein